MARGDLECGGLTPSSYLQNRRQGLHSIKGPAMGVIFNIQRFSTQDGPGIRTTVFIKGCPLRCIWCSNPESQRVPPEIAHRNSLCDQCGLCVAICRLHALSLTADGVRIDRAACNNCGDCIAVCEPGALKSYGKGMSVNEVYGEVARDRPFYEESGGGMTVCGGEPLVQPDFAAGLLERCRDSGIHTRLYTCGHASPAVWDQVLRHVDLLLFDIKTMDPYLHQEVTGQSNDVILRNLELAIGSGIPVIARVPIIPGINDSEDAISKTAKYLAGLGRIKEVSLLGYHRLGESKYAMLDRTYALHGLMPPGHQRLEPLADIFRSLGLSCEVVL